MSTYSQYSRRIGDTVNNGVAWKTPSCICSCQWCIKSKVFCSNCWMLRRRLGAATGCRRGQQYDGKCSFYLNCYFFRTSPTNRDLREKAVYFPPLAHLALIVVYIEFAWNYVRFNSNDYYFMRFTHLWKSPNYANKSVNYFAVGDSWIPVWATTSADIKNRT